MRLLEIVWYVKEREGGDVQIYLYVDIPNDSGIYEVLGKVIDMCSVPDMKLFIYLQNLPSHMKGLNISYYIHCMTRERYLKVV